MKKTMYEAHQLFNKHCWEKIGELNHFPTPWEIYYCKGCEWFNERLIGRHMIELQMELDEPIAGKQQPWYPYIIKIIKKNKLKQQFLDYLYYINKSRMSKENRRNLKKWINDISEEEI